MANFQTEYAELPETTTLSPIIATCLPLYLSISGENLAKKSTSFIRITDVIHIPEYLKLSFFAPPGHVAGAAKLDMIGKGVKEEDIVLVVIASVFDIDFLVTYNKKHLKDKQQEINGVLKKYDLRTIRIVSPEKL